MIAPSLIMGGILCLRKISVKEGVQQCTCSALSQEDTEESHAESTETKIETLPISLICNPKEV